MIKISQQVLENTNNDTSSEIQRGKGEWEQVMF
jgi:hypothetical protein